MIVANYQPYQKLKQITAIDKNRSEIMEWNTALYNTKHHFVAEYGKELLDFIPDSPEQSILDLGCGTGTLTAQLSHLASKVIGIDSSQSMIKKAKEQFGHIEFTVCDALNLPFEQEFDIIFSNAVFHWIADHSLLLKNISRSLKPEGSLVCEFGAKGNIAAIENAFAKTIKELGFNYQTKFNFTTVDAFSSLLEKNGFVIDTVYDYDRPTILSDGKQGLKNWIKQFFSAEMAIIPKYLHNAVFQNIEKLIKNTQWTGQEWVADYRRLRAIAHKTGFRKSTCHTHT